MRAVRVRAIAVALQRTNGSQWLPCLSFQPAIERRHTNSKRKRKSEVWANWSFQLERAQQCLRSNISTGHMALTEVGEKTSTQRMEGRMREIRAWRLNLERQPIKDHRESTEYTMQTKALAKAGDNLEATQKPRKRRISKQSSSTQSSATERPKATGIGSVLIPATPVCMLTHSWSLVTDCVPII